MTLDRGYEMRDIKGLEKEVSVAFYLDARNRVISREVWYSIPVLPI
jgi:hypothetical protein